MGKRTAFQIAVSAIENGEFGPEQDKAIALMNAAPDLLQLCERALALISNPDADQFMADALEVELQIGINKARGQ